jgi:vacuolar-type H+-ATPase subunit F/Vma7
LSLYGKSKVIAIVKKELVPLMKIIGIDTVFVAENHDVLNVLEKVVRDRDVGVVVIQRSLAKDINLLEFQSIGLYPSIINDVLNVLEKVVRDRDVGVVVIQRSLAKDINLLEFQSIGLYPSIITIPDASEDLSESPRSFYRDLIRRFIGYEVYLE